VKAKWNIKPTDIIKSIQADIEATVPKVLDAFSREIEVNAQKNFNDALIDISGDNPYVWVERTVGKNKARVKCVGEQVLFAEFGAGINNSFTEKDILVGEHSRVSSSGATFRVKGHTRTIVYSARGFKNGGMEETIQRPAGIVPLGTYGKGQGQNLFWVRPMRNGRYGSKESQVHKKNGDIRNDVVWTEGTRPVRGLWRARNTAISKLGSGRLNVK